MTNSSCNEASRIPDRSPARTRRLTSLTCGTSPLPLCCCGCWSNLCGRSGLRAAAPRQHRGRYWGAVRAVMRRRACSEGSAGGYASGARNPRRSRVACRAECMRPWANGRAPALEMGADSGRGGNEASAARILCRFGSWRRVAAVTVVRDCDGAVVLARPDGSDRLAARQLFRPSLSSSERAT